MAVKSAGAYGFSMASTYNSRPLAAEVLVSGEKCSLIRERGTYADLILREREPDWSQWLFRAALSVPVQHRQIRRLAFLHRPELGLVHGLRFDRGPCVFGGIGPDDRWVIGVVQPLLPAWLWT